MIKPAYDVPGRLMQKCITLMHVDVVCMFSVFPNKVVLRPLKTNKEFAFYIRIGKNHVG